MNAKTQAKALQILDGMREIANADMMARCFVAATDGAHAVGVNYDAGIMVAELPGVDEDEDRDKFLRHRHALRTAYNALNEAAEFYIKRERIEPGNYSAPVEALFESNSRKLSGDDKRRQMMLKVIAAAKRRVKAAV